MPANGPSSHSALPSVAFLVGEIPCAPFISALIDGIVQRRSVIVVGAERSGDPIDFDARVEVERVPVARRKRISFVMTGLFKLLAAGSLELEPLWRYVAKEGWRNGFNRLLFALPILVHRPDIVHVQWAKMLHRVVELRELHGFALVLSLRGTHISSSPLGDPTLLQRYQEDFPRVHAFHAVCNAIKVDSMEIGANPDRIQVIYSGIDGATLAQPLPALRSNLTPLRVLSVGRIHWRKGYHRALDAIAQLAKVHSVEYRIVAGKPDDELLLQMHDLGLEGVVRFEPAMSRSEIIEQMRTQADVLLVPSMGEGIANVAIEAMAIGLPVIATSCGGMPELIVSGKTGLLCDPWDVTSMTRALIEIAEMSIEDRDELRRNARSEISSSRKLDSLVGEMHRLYDRAISNQQSEPV